MNRQSKKTLTLFLRESSSKISEKKSSGEKGETNGSRLKKRTGTNSVAPPVNLNLLHGEESLLFEPNILLSYDEDLTIAERGPLAITNFRLILSPEVQ